MGFSRLQSGLSLGGVSAAVEFPLEPSDVGVDRDCFVASDRDTPRVDTDDASHEARFVARFAVESAIE